MAEPLSITTATPHAYRVVVNQAAVVDAIDAIYHADLRDEAILDHLPHGTEFVGIPIAARVEPDITVHGVQITYPLDMPPNAGVIAYVMWSSVREVHPRGSTRPDAARGQQPRRS